MTINNGSQSTSPPSDRTIRTNTTDRYRTALCPYLAIGNRRVLIHLDAYGVPQSLQWPRPGAVDRLGWRDPMDEWPYWDELPEDIVQVRMPYFEYMDGSRDYMHHALTVDVDYLDDTNILHGRYELPGGAIVAMTSFVLANADVWVRHYEVMGRGVFVHQSEFFEKAVRGHPLSHTGKTGCKGAFAASPQGVYVIASEHPLVQDKGRCAIPVSPGFEWTIYLCMAEDMRRAEQLADKTLAEGYLSLKEGTSAADHNWISKALPPVNHHPFIVRSYRRWLLANALCVTEDGAAMPGPRPFWSFSWPRDSSIIAAGFAAAGYLEEARSIVLWHLENTPPSRIHEARYHTDRRPVMFDNRDRQGDNPGFLAWAASFICQRRWDPDFVDLIKDHLFALADLLLTHRDEATLLMRPEADYWEGVPSQSICIAVAAVGGLMGAAQVAERLGMSTRAEAYQKRAMEIKSAACALLWDDKDNYFIRSINPTNRDCDVSACWGLYPTEAWSKDDSMMVHTLARIKRDLWSRNAGALLVGKGTPVASLWFFHTGFFLLGSAAIGDTRTTSEILASLERNASPQGLIPEQISAANGHLWGCNYLATAQALLLLFAYMRS